MRKVLSLILVPGILMTSSIIAFAATDRLPARPGGGDAEVINRTELQIIGLKESPEPSGISLGSVRKAENAPRRLPLDQIKAEVGLLLVPSYIPDGFVLYQSVVGHARMVDLFYARRGEGRAATDRDPLLVISQMPAALLQGPLKVKDGFFGSVSVGDRTGYMIQGVWGVVPKAGGNSGEAELRWDSKSRLSLAFVRDSRLVQISIHPASSSLDEATLVQVAESLQPY